MMKAVNVILLLLLFATGAKAETLTVDRLFADPDLDGPKPLSLKISPDAARITFLKGKAEDKNQLDLWEFNLEAAESRLLVDSRTLVPGKEALSEEEKARRERQRISSSKGIVEYFFSPDGAALLFPLGGDLYYYDLRAAPEEATRRLTETEEFETDPKFSPQGNYVSFIRDQDLYVIDLSDGSERQLTTDGEGLIKNGMAEFIAQEEMQRYTGYWWAPNESKIAFTQTDETPVAVYERFEIYADRIKVYPQRYPAAGTKNVAIKLGVVKLEDSSVKWMDLGGNRTVYLARVDWFPDSRSLAVQRQTRDQKRLDLLRVNAATGNASLLLSETSDTWIDLHDDLTFLQARDAFIWASARSGYKHLYLYDFAGQLIRPITTGPWMIAGDGMKRAVLGIDEEADMVYFMATKQSPLERHLYQAPLVNPKGARIDAITQRQGWHNVTIADNNELYVDVFSASSTPPQVSIHRMDGSNVAFIEENKLDETHPYFSYMENHAASEFGNIKASDGHALYYRVLKPAGFNPNQKYPAIVDVYGGPHGQRVRRKWDVGWQQYMAQHGYVVFTLDNRGTSFRGVEFDAPIYRQLGHSEVEDQVAGVKYLKSLAYVDGARIGIFGWSYGGYMTLMTMMKAPEAFAAGVSGAPVTDWTLYDTHYTERYLGQPEDNAEGYEASSVFSYVDKLQKPLLIIHGMADDNVLFTNSTKLFGALQELGKPFDMMTYPGAKHGLIRHRGTGVHAYKMVKRFFDRQLKPAS